VNFGLQTAEISLLQILTRCHKPTLWRHLHLLGANTFGVIWAIDSEKVFFKLRRSPIYCPKSPQTDAITSHYLTHLLKISHFLYCYQRVLTVITPTQVKQTLPQVRKLTVYARNLVLPTSETWGAKTTYFRVVLRRHIAWIYQNLVNFGPKRLRYRIFDQPSAVFIWRAGRRSSQLKMSKAGYLSKYFTTAQITTAHVAFSGAHYLQLHKL